MSHTVWFPANRAQGPAFHSNAPFQRASVLVVFKLHDCGDLVHIGARQLDDTVLRIEAPDCTTLLLPTRHINLFFRSICERAEALYPDHFLVLIAVGNCRPLALCIVLESLIRNQLPVQEAFAR